MTYLIIFCTHIKEAILNERILTDPRAENWIRQHK